MSHKTVCPPEPIPDIETLLLLPPIAIARTGASPTPLENYEWVEDSGQFAAGRTAIRPAASIEVCESGEQSVYVPGHIRFRDAGLIRPVCPFFELWYTSRGSKEPRPLTIDLLEKLGASIGHVTYEVVAVNRKAARRTHDEACRYEAHLRVSAADFTKQPLLASSPNTVGNPLVLRSRPIPLGQFQALRPVHARKSGSHLKAGVNLSVIRARYTPPAGEVYGPPGATEAADPGSRRVHELVIPRNRITNQDASWNQHDAARSATDPMPSGTYDGDEDPARNSRAFGVVDDMCDLVVRARLAWNGRVLESVSRIFCGPPDFAPDRRPFFSLVDELSDRDPASYSQGPLCPAELTEYVLDLFRRISETASLINVDLSRVRMYRTNHASGVRRSTQGMPRIDEYTMRIRKDRIHDDSAYLSDEAKKLFEDDPEHDAQSDHPATLPRHRRATVAHEELADPEALLDFLRLKRERFLRLIRPPYRRFRDLPHAPGGAADLTEERDIRVPRDRAFDMRMPPYMRDSDSYALSLTRRQYQLLLKFLDELPRLEFPAKLHSRAVLERLRSKS